MARPPVATPPLSGRIPSSVLLQPVQFFRITPCPASVSLLVTVNWGSGREWPPVLLPVAGERLRPVRATRSDRGVRSPRSRERKRPPGAFAPATNAGWPTILLSARTKALAERESGRFRPL